MITQETINGLDCYLVMIPHNWRYELLCDIQRKVVISKTRNRKEGKTVVDHTNLISLTLRLSLERDEADAVIGTLYALEGGTLAFPMWNDQQTGPTDANRAFSGSHYVSYDNDLTYDYDIDAMTYSKCSPLLFGKIDKIQPMDAITDGYVEYKIVLHEDCPFTHKVTPFTKAHSDAWPSTLKHDWSNVLRVGSDSGVERKRFDGQRESYTIHDDGVHARTENLYLRCMDRTEIQELVSFWDDRYGAGKSFLANTSLIPETDTEEHPEEIRFRFAGDALKLRYRSDSVLTCSIKLEETPWELLGGAVVPGRLVYLMKFDYDIPGKASVFKTTHQETINFGGDDYLPMNCEVQDINDSTDLSFDPAKIKMLMGSDNPLNMHILHGIPESLFHVKIYMTDELDLSNIHRVFYGDLIDAPGDSKVITAEFSPFGGLGEKKIPWVKFQKGCNDFLGGPRCGIDLESVKCTATVSSLSITNSNNMQLQCLPTGDITSVADPDSGTGDKFAGGYIEIGSGDNYQFAFIVKTTVVGGTDLNIEVSQPLDPDKMDASGNMSIYPNCFGSVWECDGNWSNYPNGFFGFPFIPAEMDQASPNSPSNAK